MGIDGLIFVISTSSQSILPECRATLFAVQQCLTPATPVVVLVDQPPSSSLNELKTPIEEFKLINSDFVGIRQLKVYSVCTQTGEGIYSPLMWLFNLFLERLEMNSNYPNTARQPCLRHDLYDDYVFSSGETYFERLFATVDLWKQTREVIREQPLRKEQILLRYERQMREVLQGRKDDMGHTRREIRTVLRRTNWILANKEEEV